MRSCSPTADMSSYRIEIYFEQDHHAAPLFNRQIFIEQYESGQLSTVSAHAVAAVTAAIYADDMTNRPESARSYLDALLRSPWSSELELSFDISLHEFQLITLLAHYDFHQRPGPRSWVRIGNLTRKV